MALLSITLIIWLTLLNCQRPIWCNEQPLQQQQPNYNNKCLLITTIDDNLYNLNDNTTIRKILRCSNVTLQSINNDYLTNTPNVFTELTLTNILNSNDNELLLKNESSTELLSWTDSRVQQTQFDSLLLPAKRFIRLRKLDVSDNRIHKIEREHFRKLQTLKQLNLSRNSIDELPQYVFSDLHNLLELDLSENRLKSIVANGFSLFGQLNELIVLDLANNSISDLPHVAFNGLHQLNRLNLAHNKLFVVPFQVFRVLKNIETIDLSHNNLVSILDNFFTPNGKLKSLNFHNNIIEQLSKHSLFGLNQLHTLDISKNRLITIDRNAFDSLVNLRHLNLSENLFAIISSTTFTALINLNTLDLSKNIVKKLPNGIFASQYELKELILEKTAIEKLGNWISRKNATINKNILVNLKSIVIRDNEYLTEIDSITFRNTPALNNLILSGNRLQSVPKELGDLTELEVLDISGNELVSIPWQMGNLMNLKELHLLDNDFSCDCRMYWLVDWIDEMQTKYNGTAINDTSVDLLKLQLNKLKCRHGYPGDMLRVLQQLHCTKPVIVHSSKTDMHLLRSDAILECSFVGNPAPDIIWVTPKNKILRYYADPDTKPLSFETNGKLNNKNPFEFQMLIGNHFNFTVATSLLGVSLLENGSLKVHNISRKDSGVYTCYGYNIMGNATTDIRYIIYINPKVEQF